MCENEVLNADTQIQNWTDVYFILVLLFINYMGVNDPLNQKPGIFFIFHFTDFIL